MRSITRPPRSGRNLAASTWRRRWRTTRRGSAALAASKLGAAPPAGGLRARLLVSAAGAPLVLGLVLLGGVSLRVLVALTAAGAAAELGTMLANAGLRPQRGLLATLSVLLAALSGLVPP